MIKFITGLVAFTFSGLSLLAGSADASIVGQSSSKRTKLEVLVQDIDGSVNAVKLTVDGKVLEFTHAHLRDGVSKVVCDRKHAVYTLYASDGDRELTLWMIPQSMKILKRSASDESWSFRAIVFATDPRRQTTSDYTPQVELMCHMTYAL